MPFINKTRKFVFIGNARCGSTSMYIRLYNLFYKDEIIWEKQMDAEPWLYHMGIEQTLKRYPFA